MKSWFAANIDTNMGLSGPFSFNHVPATRESGDAPKILSKQSGFKKRQTDPEYPLGLE
jgi:hypothetical protein